MEGAGTHWLEIVSDAAGFFGAIALAVPEIRAAELSNFFHKQGAAINAASQSGNVDTADDKQIHAEAAKYVESDPANDVVWRRVGLGLIVLSFALRLVFHMTKS